MKALVKTFFAGLKDCTGCPPKLEMVDDVVLLKPRHETGPSTMQGPAELIKLVDVWAPNAGLEREEAATVLKRAKEAGVVVTDPGPYYFCFASKRPSHKEDLKDYAGTPAQDLWRIK